MLKLGSSSSIRWGTCADACDRWNHHRFLDIVDTVVFENRGGGHEPDGVQGILHSFSSTKAGIALCPPRINVVPISLGLRCGEVVLKTAGRLDRFRGNKRAWTARA
jgi:hypothetical protein